MAEKSQFAVSDMLEVLTSEGLKKFLSDNLGKFKTFKASERNVQAYILHYILQNCFYGEDSQYHPRFINIECPELELIGGGKKRTDICLKAEHAPDIIELWIEIKNFTQVFGSFDYSNVRADFCRMSRLPKDVQQKLMLIIGDFGINGHLNTISSIAEEYPSVKHEVIVLE